MISFWKVIQIASIVLSFTGVFLATYSDSIIKPDLKISVNLTPSENFTLATITIQNTGLKPATNVRLTFNPEDNILKYAATFYTEEIKFESDGPQSLVGKMDRFANDQDLIVTTLLNSTNVTNYAIFATHDKGSTNYYYGKPMPYDIELFLSLGISLITAATAAFSTEYLRRRYKNITITKTQISDRGAVNVQDVINSNITRTDNITQIFGISSLSDAEKLIELLFQQNFPKIKEEAQKTARESAEKFCQTFLSRAKSELKPKDIQKLSNPDLQFILNASVIQTGRTDEQDLRENLAYLLVERIKNSDDNLRRIVYNESIDTIGKLTGDELKIIALCFLLRYTKFGNIANLEDLNNLLARIVSPFLDFKNTNAEFQHIVYTGCGSIDTGSWNCLDSILNGYPHLIPLTIIAPQVEMLRIPNEILEDILEKHSDTEFKFKVLYAHELEKYLKDKQLDEITKNSMRSNFQMSRNMAIGKLSESIKDKEYIQKAVKIVFETPLQNLSLTSVGIVIAAMYCERILEDKFDINHWIN